MKENYLLPSIDNNDNLGRETDKWKAVYAKKIVADEFGGKLKEDFDNLVTKSDVESIVKDSMEITAGIKKQTYILDGLKIHDIEQEQGIQEDGSIYPTQKISISQGTAVINGKPVQLNTGIEGTATITLCDGQTQPMEYINDLSKTPDKFSYGNQIIVMDENGNLDRVKAKLPDIDKDTVCYWTFTNVNDAVEPNRAVGIGELAVENNATPYNGPVLDYKCGLTGVTKNTRGTSWWNLDNTTNIPTTGEVEFACLFTMHQFINNHSIIAYFGGPASEIDVNTSSQLVIYISGGAITLPYNIELEEPIFLVVQRDINGYRCFVNGVCYYEGLGETSASFGGTGTTPCIGTWQRSTSYYFDASFEYVEIRRKCRSKAEIGKITNELLIPCFYTSKNSNYYNNFIDEIEHEEIKNVYEWKFDNLNSDCNHVYYEDNQYKSEIIKCTDSTSVTYEENDFLGGSVRFHGDAKSYFDYPNPVDMNVKTDGFTVIAIAAPYALGSYGRLFGTSDTSIMCCATVDGENVMGFYNNGTWVRSKHIPKSQEYNFFMWRAKGGQTETYQEVEMRLNNETEIHSANVLVDKVNKTMRMGMPYNTSYVFRGPVAYLVYCDGYLPDSIVNNMYNNMMNKGRKNIIDTINNNFIDKKVAILAHIRNNRNEIETYNDHDYWTGRREQATKGNRCVFTGWKYIWTSHRMSFENPFRSRYIKVTPLITQHPEIEGMIASPPELFYSGSNNYGIYSNFVEANSDYTYVDNFGVKNILVMPTSYPCWSNYYSSGYLGLFIECLEEEEGISE